MSESPSPRPAVPAHERFVQRAAELKHLDLRARFARIYETNLWGSEASVSGSGSVHEQTAAIRAKLPVLLSELKVRSMLDIPCGDFGWMRELDLSLISYTGADIVPDLITRHQREFSTTGRNFVVLDLTHDRLPAVDLVFCRDCLVHLSFQNIWKAISNLKESGSRWLLTTTFSDNQHNADIEDGDWRLLNLERSPFCFPPPVALLREECTEHEGAYADKSLGLWAIADLPDAPIAP